MGLAIVWSIIDAHSGTIRAENVDGAGAQFTFSLPLRILRSNELRSVFVIDDDPSIRKGLARLLRLANYETEVFESASDFLARPQHPRKPCCVIVDVQMPRLNGLAFPDNPGVTSTRGTAHFHHWSR